MRILFVDSYYEDVIAHLMRRPDSPGADAARDDADMWDRMAWLGLQCHGTADYWERAVQEKGHLSRTVVLNAPFFANDLIAEHVSGEWDVVAYQNVSDRKTFYVHGPKHVAFCSYRASDEDLKGWDAVFTSFPHQVERIRNLGTPAYYLPLAFDPIVVERTKNAEPMVENFYGPVRRPIIRNLPVTFAGGIGHGHIWNQGTSDIRDVAINFPLQFKWWGYGPIKHEALLESYCGKAWGTDYFKVLLQSSISLNRHGEIAGEYANNMRMFEATGCGSCLLTNEAINMGRFFRPMEECMTYRDRHELIRNIDMLLNDEDLRHAIAKAGRKRCLGQHTYAHRAVEFLDVLEKL